MLEGELIRDMLSGMSEDDLLKFVRALERWNRKLVTNRADINGALSWINELHSYYRIAVYLLSQKTAERTTV